MERLAADFIPTVMARGFHAGPVFGIFGPAVAAAKILRLTEDQVNSAIALCASLASSNLEGPRSGGRALREGAAVRNAMLAVALAQQGHVGGETVLEGPAGFYHRSEEHTSELQSRGHLVCRLLLEKKKKNSYSTRLNRRTKSITKV